jgi:hypothetical protein
MVFAAHAHGHYNSFAPAPLVALLCRHPLCSAGDAEADQLIGGALSSGFLGGFFVDFPHSSSAKKYYICIQKVGNGSGPGAAASLNPSTHCCNLAWPKRGELCGERVWWLGRRLCV